MLEHHEGRLKPSKVPGASDISGLSTERKLGLSHRAEHTHLPMWTHTAEHMHLNTQDWHTLKVKQWQAQLLPIVPPGFQKIPSNMYDLPSALQISEESPWRLTQFWHKEEKDCGACSTYHPRWWTKPPRHLKKKKKEKKRIPTEEFSHWSAKECCLPGCGTE